MTQQIPKLELDSQQRTAVLSGVCRLESVEAYEQWLRGVFAAVRAGAQMTIDLTRVPLMNSSGVRALANLVVEARDHGAVVRLLGRASVPWQKKTLASLKLLDGKHVVDLTDDEHG